MSRAEEIAQALGGAKRTAEGYVCKCPCHEDKTASLSLKVKDGGGIILNCFAGCAWQDVLAEIKRRGLVEDRPRNLSAPSTALPAPTRATRSNKYDGAKFYEYKDLVGNLLCRKVKLPSKKQWFERWDASGKCWRAGLEGMVVPLYNIAAVVAATVPVYLAEGEKDAETLIAAGLVGTTNSTGAGSWADHLTEQLRGKTVVILPDNDEPGKKRVAKLSKALQGIVKELRLFVPDNVPDHGDITDWVNAGGDPSKIFERSTVLEGKKSKHATHDEYYALFDETLNAPRRCIFSENLMHFDPVTKLWNPAVNALDRLKAAALRANETRDAKFSPSYIAPHFAEYANSKPLEFLVDVPEWDGEDRIGAMVELLNLRESQNIDLAAAQELLKEWCARMFQRLKDPMIQNRILVLQGAQGIGKDTWTSMLVDGLGQFSVPLAIVAGDKDTYLNLHRGLVMKLSEFDKTSKTEVSIIKDIITLAATNVRAPYDRDAKLRHSRCSFVSSANIRNILRDPTGNRRFLILELESIDYGYSGWTAEQKKTWQMQCLAQMARLADQNYSASPGAWAMMNEYIKRETPEDYAVDLTRHFVEEYRSNPTLSQSADIAPNDRPVREIVAKVAKDAGLRPAVARAQIQSQLGRFRRFGEKRFWVWQLPDLEHEGEPRAANGAGRSEQRLMELDGI